MEEHNENNEIYSQRIKAGRRTYFFDIKTTRGKDYYLTITESRKRFKENGEGFSYEKHKIFLYKEDLNKFQKALNETATHIREKLMPEYDFSQFDRADQDTQNDQEEDTA